MNENLEDRKLRMKLQLEEEYESKKQVKCWGSPDEYIPTKKMVRHCIPLPTGNETIIRRDLKSALIMGAFFMVGIIVSAASILNGNLSQKSDDIFALLVCIAFMIVLIIPRLNRKPIIILNESGIWTDERKELIPWEYLVKSYIREDNTGEDTVYRLVFCYYYEPADQFLYTDIRIGSLEVNERRLASEIESWKLFAANLQTAKDNCAS